METQNSKTQIGQAEPRPNSVIRFFPLILILIIAFVVIYFFQNGSLSLSTNSPINNTIDIKFSEKNYSLKFPQIFDKNLSQEIVGFEEKEGWKGTFTFDDSIFYEGESSLVLNSRDHSLVSASMEKNLDLSNFDTFKMVTYIATDEEVDNIEFLTLKFSNKDETVSYSYPFTTLKKGWDVVKMTKDAFTLSEGKGTLNWKNIEKVSLELVSRPKAKTEIIIDRLWAERGEDYKDYVRSLNYDNVSYKSFNNKQYLNLWNLGSYLITLKKVTSVTDFVYSAKLIPQKSNPFGIAGRIDGGSGYGYYLSLNGINTGSWKIIKNGKTKGKSPWITLSQGSINNFVIEKDKPVWLKLEFKGAKIIGYISMDGSNYTKLTETVDREYKSGGIGVFSLGASTLIDEVNFTQ